MCISDCNDDRVVFYKPDQTLSQPFHNGQQPFRVVGQPDLISNELLDPSNANTLASPWAIAFDLEGNLWTVDCLYNRVLQYPRPFNQDFQSASVFIGQSSSNSPLVTNATADNPTPSTKTSLFTPSGLAFDEDGNLWVSDSGHNRILRYKPPFTAFSKEADIVLGKRDFIS
jgi:sugar lactone lactonase YvrE